MFTDLQNTDGSTESNKFDINNRPARENISGNVEIPVEESLEYHNISRNKQRSD